ncbi:MAG: PIN domain-containing protein [Candidatus Hadarchaeaceae archaeon]
MPVVDTEVLFAFSPRDPKHARAMRILNGRDDVAAPDVAVLEFQLVLRARGRRPAEVKMAMLALHEALARYRVREMKTISSSSLALQCELEEKYGLSYFDSLIAVAALALDRKVISSDEDFDSVLGLERIPLR